MRRRPISRQRGRKSRPHVKERTAPVCSLQKNTSTAFCASPSRYELWRLLEFQINIERVAHIKPCVWDFSDRISNVCLKPVGTRSFVWMQVQTGAAAPRWTWARPRVVGGHKGGKTKRSTVCGRRDERVFFVSRIESDLTTYDFLHPVLWRSTPVPLAAHPSSFLTHLSRCQSARHKRLCAQVRVYSSILPDTPTEDNHVMTVIPCNSTHVRFDACWNVVTIGFFYVVAQCFN